MSVREVSGWRDGSRKLKIHPSIHLLIPHQGRGGRWGLSSAPRTHAGAGFHNLGRNKCVQERLARAGEEISSLASAEQLHGNRYLKI